jgi:hypothetical protein
MEISGGPIIQDCFIQCLKTMVWQMVVLEMITFPPHCLMFLQMVVPLATKKLQNFTPGIYARVLVPVHR